MKINERLCLVIDGCILILRHSYGFTFPGGSVNNEELRIGETCLRECEEELGIRITSVNPLLISHYSSKNSLHLLFYVNLKKKDIEFVKASHVWEIRAFTLIPTSEKCEPEKLAEWFVQNIRDNNPCSSYISLKNGVVEAIGELRGDLANNKNIIFNKDDTYYVRLLQHPKLSDGEKKMLRQINLIVNGYDDEINTFQDDFLCKIKYIPHRKFMYMQMSTNAITQIDYYSYESSIRYSDITTEDDLKKSLTKKDELPDDIVSALKSIVSNVKQKLSNFGLKELGNVSYYYLDNEAYCCMGEMPLMFDDIDDFDYIEPIKRLAKYYNGSTPNYYETILKKYGDTKLSSPLYVYDFDYELDEIILQYTKCINNLSIMITWPVCNINDIYKTEFYSELSKQGNIHAIKEIVVSQKQLQGIIHQVYYDKSVFKRFDVVRNKADRCGVKENNRIFIIFYKAHDVKSITGTDAPFKVTLRKILKVNSMNSHDLKDNLYLHISDNHSEAVELAQLFCNKNSMRLLQYQRLDRLLQRDFWKSLIYLMTIKSWLYSNIQPVDHIRFMLFSSIVLYTLGLRNVNDLDMIIHYLPSAENTKTQTFFEIINKYLESDRTKFPFVVDGASMKGRNGWVVGGDKEYLIDWFEKEWPNMFGATSMDDIILNPRFHYYYFGMKIVSVEGDTKRRIQRSRPAAYADLLAMKRFVFDKLDITKVPDGYWKNHVYYKFTENEHIGLVKKIIYYLRNRYNLNMRYTEIRKILL